MKRFISILLAFILLISLSTNVFSSGFTAEISGFYVETADVPSYIDEYATYVFSNIGIDVISKFLIPYTNTDEITLSQGFRMIDVDTMEYSDIAYYYLIYSSNGALGIMTISDDNGKLGYQIERNQLAFDIFSALKDGSEPYKIYVSDDAYYFARGNNVTHVSYISSIQKELDTASKKNYIKVTDISSKQPTVTSYPSKKITNPLATRQLDVNNISINSANSSSSYGDILTIVPVDNAAIYVNGESHYTCWASVIAAVSYYYKTGCSNTYSDDDINAASLLRYGVIAERLNDTNNDPGISIADTVYYVNERISEYGYGFLSYYYKPSKLDIISIMNSTTNRHPSITGWYSTSNNIGHAMVLCGYSYDSSTALYTVFLSDPNSQPVEVSPGITIHPVAICGYDSSYVIGSNLYVWNTTACVNWY